MGTARIIYNMFIIILTLMEGVGDYFYFYTYVFVKLYRFDIIMKHDDLIVFTFLLYLMLNLKSNRQHR